jgi:cytoskeleton protein RodZ
MPRAEKPTAADDASSLGHRLATARQSKGLELEKAAHDTRIRPQRLRDLEADDYSRFPHPSYARMFLADYAKYLGIPVADIRAQLPESGDCGAGGYEYLETLGGEPADERVTTRRVRPRRRVMPLLFGAAAVVIIGALAINLTVTIRKLEQLGLSQPAEKAEVLPAAPPIESAAPATAVEPEDLALLHQTLAQPAPEAFAPANLATPVPTPDERAALVGGTLDVTGRIQ